jgi:predicted regulator of Ras-like GTPase activity (Roadblock/LC7/MglB family)
MEINSILKDIVNNVDDALGCGVVDLRTGMLLGLHHTVPYFTQSYLDAVGAAAVDLFRGKNISNVYKLLASHAGSEDNVGRIREIQTTSDHTFHFMTTIPHSSDALLVLITGKKANIGMGWATVRKAVTDIAPFCPH